MSDLHENGFKRSPVHAFDTQTVQTKPTKKPLNNVDEVDTFGKCMICTGFKSGGWTNVAWAFKGVWYECENEGMRNNEKNGLTHIHIQAMIDDWEMRAMLFRLLLIHRLRWRGKMQSFVAHTLVGKKKVKDAHTHTNTHIWIQITYLKWSLVFVALKLSHTWYSTLSLFILANSRFPCVLVVHSFYPGLFTHVHK